MTLIQVKSFKTESALPLNVMLFPNKLPNHALVRKNKQNNKRCAPKCLRAKCSVLTKSHLSNDSNTPLIQNISPNKPNKNTIIPIKRNPYSKKKQIKKERTNFSAIS